MKNARICTALAVLSMIILLMVGSVLTVQHCCGRLLLQAERIEASLGTEQAAEEIEALEASWRRYSIPLHLFVPNQPLTDLNETVFRLRAMHTDGCDELRAELAAVRADLEWIRGQELSLF